MIKGQEFHNIIKNIFTDVNGYLQSEQLQVNCPRCQEREGLHQPDGKFNLEINTAKRMFRCWKCDEPRFSGSLGKLIRLYGSRGDYEIYKSYSYTADDYDYYNDEDEVVNVELPKEMISFSNMESGNLLHYEAYNYLINERKISRDIILKYRLGFCIDGKYSNRIIIPSYNANGEINYFVSRTYDPRIKKMKYDNPKANKDRIIFNEGYINWDSTVYLVEGAFDMLSFPINTIPMLGKTISSALFKKINEIKPNIIVLLDPDAFKDTINLYYTLQNIYIGCEDRIKFVKLPNNEDIDEVKRHHGDDKIIEYLRGARGLTIDDYFAFNLSKPNEDSGRGRYNSYSKYHKWQ